jgi:hypothetical protein
MSIVMILNKAGNLIFFIWLEELQKRARSMTCERITSNASAYPILVVFSTDESAAIQKTDFTVWYLTTASANSKA